MENSLLTYSKPTKLLEFKLDFSCLETELNNKLSHFDNQLKAIQTQSVNLETHTKSTHQEFNQQIKEIIGRLNNLENSQHKHQLDLKSLLTKINSQENNLKLSLPPSNVPKISSGVNLEEKTPTEVLDLIDHRSSVKIKENPNQPKEIEINSNPPNSDRVCYTVRVKQVETPNKNDKVTVQVIDKKCYMMYAKIMEEIDRQITQTRQNLFHQLSEISSSKNTPSQVNIKPSTPRKSLTKQTTNQAHQVSENRIPSGKLSNSVKSIQRNKKLQINNRITHEFDVSATHKSRNSELQKRNENSIDQSTLNQHIDYAIQKFREEIKEDLDKIKNENTNKFEQITSINSTFADKILQTKKLVEENTNQTDSLKLEAASTSDKMSNIQRQVNLVLQSNTDIKSRVKSLEAGFGTLKDEIRGCQESIKLNQEIYEHRQEEIEESPKKSPHQSKKDVFHDSRSSFRESVVGGLNPIRHGSILKQNNIRLDSNEENVRVLASKLSNLIDRVNRMEDQKKKFGESFSGMFPKIDKENNKSSSANHFEIIRKEIKKVNDDILKTNEKLNTTKQRLNSLYEEHSVIPNQIQDIYIKLREYNQFQEDRLIELIKELINRMLSDPFDNHFTNRLKREINVKFLEIKHEYHSILKQIQSKVEDRAEKSQVRKTTHKFEENMAELKAMSGKKCDVEDFKKGVKYLQNKIKEVYQYAKDQTSVLKKEQKQYIGVKKQSFC